MTFNSKSRIPLELYRLIIGHIGDKATLFSMLLSSRAFCADVERKLYHSIHFHYTGDEKHILFLESVLDIKRPHLPDLVYRYSYISTCETSTAHRALIKRALVTFTNLKQLLFIISNEESFVSVLPIESPPFNLKLFTWIAFGGADRNAGVLHFIASQPSLKTLHVPNLSSGLPQISLQNLQNLNDLAGNVGIILPLLPKSVPINRLHWSMDISRDLSHFPVLPRLRVLSLTKSSTSSSSLRPPLSDLIKRFKNVKVLGLQSLHPDELLDLYCFPLHTLVLGRIFHDAVPTLIQEIFHNMKLLRRIFVSAGSHNYLRWDMHAETAVHVSDRAIETNWWCRL